MDALKTKRAVIYCRVSTKEQVDEGGSLASQEKNCKEYALKTGYVVTRVFIEQGESAKNANRTQLTELLNFCTTKKNGISAVIAYKIDRIARNIDDYRQIRLILKKNGVEIKSTSEFFEDTPAGRFMENIIANVAQFDNDVRTERSVGGMRDAIKEGRFVWQAPLGYDNVKIGGKTNIIPNAMAPLIQEAFAEVAKNILPVDDIRRKMVAKGLATRKGKAVPKSTFYILLTNKLYMGIIVGLGEKVKGSYQPLVSEDLFDQVQRVLKHRTHRKLQYKRDNPDFPLRRFVSHPSGKKLTGCWAKGRSNKYPYYLFHIKGLEFRKEDLDVSFKDFLNQFRLNEQQYTKLKAMVKINLVKATQDYQKEVKQAEKFIADLKERQRGLILKNLDGVISDLILQDQLELIETEIIRTSSWTVSPFDFGSADIEEALSLASAYLKDPSSVWENAPLQCKLKLQWFNFPKGITFDGNEFRTAEICNLFKAREENLHALSSVVNPATPALNNSDAPNSLYWSGIALEIITLSEIIQEISGKTPEKGTEV